MKVFITKYALTQGILEEDAKTCSENMVMTSRDGWTEYFHGKDWHETREEAVERARFMRVKKIASLENQLAKLRSLTF